MSESIAPPQRDTPLDRLCGALGPRVRTRVRALFSLIEVGEITLVEGGVSEAGGEATAAFPLRCRLTIHDERFYGYLALRGALGAAESYMLGYWDCDDLTAVVRIVAANRQFHKDVDGLLARASGLLTRLGHWHRRNHRWNSRRNIEAHYDLGRDFYDLFLDPSRTYSSAFFEAPEATLEQAQVAKYERICQKLDLRAGDELLEIGCGWGGFAVHAASRYGCRVTATTVSPDQFGCASQAVRAAGLADRVTILQDDYRDLGSQFDKLVSIEMIEAVGEEYFDRYFQVCSDRLRPDGMMLLQAILTPDPRYAQGRHTVDIIKRYIFPGGHIPSLGSICAAVGRVTDFRIVHVEDIGPHYARTLGLWLEHFAKNLDAVRDQGFSETFIRMWRYYLCSCQAGFAERVIGVSQLALIKPRCQRPPILGALEALPAEDLPERFA